MTETMAELLERSSPGYIFTIAQEQLDSVPQREHCWRFPGVDGPGRYTWNEARHTYRPVGLAMVMAPEAAPDGSPADFDRTGLGIGGAGRHDPGAEMGDLIARGKARLVERRRVGPMPHGELWEPCAKWGCDVEPVCVDCGRCEYHCEC